MNGKDFVSLINELGIKISPASKSQWSAKSEITVRILRNVFNSFEKQRFYDSIEPVTEFHEFHFDHKGTTDSFANRIGNKAIVRRLKDRDSIGIYAFFDASGRVIYIGKTENNLFAEMEQRYWHKPLSVRYIKNGKSSSKNTNINDVAQYCSAYKTAKHLITNVEALLTRIILNSASNIRVESFHGLK